MVRKAWLPFCALALAGVFAAPAAADEAGAPSGFWQRPNLLGDIGGLRTILGKHGLSLGLSETSEVFANPTGGLARGAIYEGATEMSLGVDLDKAIGLPGGTVEISAYQIHGHGLSATHLDNLNVVSGIEAEPSTRLFELWYDQAFLDGKVDVKIGQQAADQEFMLSKYGAVFINSGFGWPTLAAEDLPSDGPAYPLATPGVRLRVRPTERLTTMLGIFNGNPAGPGTGDPQQRDASGTNFNIGSGAFVIAEAQYATDPGDHPTGLPGTYKLGAWYNSNSFDDPFYANSGLIHPPGTRRGDWSVYAGMDQMVYRVPGTKDSGAGVFLRAAGAPGDRNPINVFVDGGVTYKGAFGRDDDIIGLGVEWARIGDRARAGDAAFSHLIRTSETVLELTYQAQVAPWLIVQPDFQYIFNPGAGIADPDRPGRKIGDAAVFGLRTTVAF